MDVRGITSTPHLRLDSEISDGARPTAAQGEGAASFEDVVFRTIDEANRADRTAAAKVDALARGAEDDLHGTMIAVKEADISVKLVGTIRNKLLDAFQEIWKTSV